MLKHRLIFGVLLFAAFFAIFWIDSRLDRIPIGGVLSDAFGGRTWLPNGLALYAVCLVVTPIAAWELTRIFRANQIMATAWLTALAAELGLIVHYSIPYDMRTLTALAIVISAMAAVFVGSIWYYSRDRNVDGIVAAAGGTMFAMIYLGLLLGFYLALRRWHSVWLILAILMVTKSCDIGAYFTGRAIGKHKLIPWLSPGKTWEGLAGGLATSTIVASLLGVWGRSIETVHVRPGLEYDYWYPPLLVAAAGILFGLIGQIGDLTASLLKRDAGLKDSSTLLPGFGGVLDVLDSPLLVAPVAYWMLARL